MKPAHLNYVRSRNLYDPLNKDPFKISRSKLDSFIKCRRCFYLDRRLGVGQPPSFPFNLNNAVDLLLKKEFDLYRQRGVPHPLMVEAGFKGIPFQHASLEHWRDALRGGISYHHTNSNLLLTGGIDDVWINSKKEICIVDYKATAKEGRPTIDGPWQASYPRQLDIYVWLFRKNNFLVSNTAYFVYCNGLLAKPEFNARLDFDIEVLPYEANDSWVEEALNMASQLLRGRQIPDYSPGCEYCKYQQALHQVTQQQSFDLA